MIVLVSWAAISIVERWPGQAAAWRRDGHLIVENSRTGQRWPLYTDVLDDVTLNGRGPLDIAAAAGPILRAHPPALRLHKTFYDGQPEAGSTRQCPRRPVELVKNFRQ